MAGIEGRKTQPTQPALQQFDAGLLGGAGRPTQPSLLQAGGERRNPFSLEKPVDLVGSIRTAIEQARAAWRGPFNAPWWLRTQLQNTWEQGDHPQETGILMKNVVAAYDTLAYNYYPSDDYRDTVAMDLRIWVTVVDKENSITLTPPGVQMLEAMAQATDIPYTPGQTKFELPEDVKQGLTGLG